MVKRFCLLLTVLCVLMLSGCSDLPAVSDPGSTPIAPPVSDPQPGVQNLSVAYSHDDTLNPFTAKTEANLNLAGLLYDSLAVMDESFVPQPSLAAEISAPDSTHLLVTLREGAVFSDGSSVTPEDVVTSFQRAKASVNYKALLTNVTGAKGDGKSRQITFTLAAADPNAMGCLTFPVVKAATLTDEEAKAPIGGGLYMLQTTDDGAQLVKNPHSKATPFHETVGLRHLPNSTAMYYALASGDITYYFDDLSGGELPRITGASRAVDMNALLFIGVNGGRGKMAVPAVRRALSGLLDRSAIAKAVYSDWATPSLLPFHPRWQPLAGYEAPSTSRDLDGALALLDQAGCTAGSGGVRLTLELIYCTDSADRGKVAELVRSQMEGGGVTLTLVPLNKADYLTRLKNGQYDLYVGEIRLTADMSLRPLLMGGEASYGISRSGACATAYTHYLAGDLTLEEFLTSFAAELPYIPVCWRSGLAAFDRRLTAVTPSAFDPYYGMAGWK